MQDSTPHPYTILFLIADTGAGHRRASDAIRHAINLLLATPGTALDSALAQVHQPYAYRSDILDAFAVCGSFPLRNISQLYGWSIRYTPWLYGRLFHLTNHPWSLKLLDQMIYRLMCRGLSQLLQRTRPDMIVCVHPLLGHTTQRVLAELGTHIPLLTVVTDPVTPHLSWIDASVDHCIVPTETARDFCRRHGMPDDHVQVLGMPIDLTFSRPAEPKPALRRKLGLHPTMPTVLLAGGGEGAGKLMQMVRAIWQAELPIQLLIVTGRNEQLRHQLEKLARQCLHLPQKRCQILGFVQNMPELMQAADLIVTKAGPGTISEAIACRLPIVLSGFVPGQEEGNARAICNQGIGLMAETPEKLVATLQACFHSNARLLEQMRANMAHLAHLQNPLAALSIAEYILRTAAHQPAHSSDAGVA